MSTVLNLQLNSIIENIYRCGGDIINFESYGILAVWKVRKPLLIFKTLEIVIKSAIKFQEDEQSIRNTTKLSIKCT